MGVCPSLYLPGFNIFFHWDVANMDGLVVGDHLVSTILTLYATVSAGPVETNIGGKGVAREKSEFAFQKKRCIERHIPRVYYSDFLAIIYSVLMFAFKKCFEIIHVRQ